MNIKVLGSGCAKCKKLFSLVKEVVNEAGIDASIEKVEDITEIIQYDVASTPALVIDEKVALKGRLPRRDELEKILKDHSI